MPPINVFNRPRGTARGVIVALAAVSLALCAVVTGSRPASAAATLSVPANPVVVPSGSNSTTTTLSWNLGGIAKAQLKVQETGGAVVLSQAVTSQTGSAPLTVTHGKTYTATLNDAINPATVLASLSITTKRPPLSFDPDCSGQCITGVTVDPHGTYAGFHITTNESAHFEVQVGTSAPTNHVFASVTSARFNLSNVTDWTITLPNLKPNTSYYYVVRATDAAGHVAYKEGQFKTLKRQVTVMYTYVHMIDDSDNGDGAELRLWFLANNLPAQEWEGNASSGATIFLPIAFSQTNAPDTLKLRVTGKDNDEDCGFFSGVCVSGFAMPDGNGGDGLGQWSTVTKSIVLPTGLGEVTGGEFDMTSAAPLKFQVHGTYIVTYVP